MQEANKGGPKELAALLVLHSKRALATFLKFNLFQPNSDAVEAAEE